MAWIIVVIYAITSRSVGDFLSDTQKEKKPKLGTTHKKAVQRSASAGFMDRRRNLKTT